MKVVYLVLLVLNVVTLFVVVPLAYAFPLVRVIGCSMSPTYRGGELLRGKRFFSRRKLKKGDVICYYDTENRDHVVVKRIDKVITEPGDEIFFYCLGDNAPHSYDSRHYGAIHSSRVICRLLDQRNKNA